MLMFSYKNKVECDFELIDYQMKHLSDKCKFATYIMVDILTNNKFYISSIRINEDRWKMKVI